MAYFILEFLLPWASPEVWPRLSHAPKCNFHSQSASADAKRDYLLWCKFCLQYKESSLQSAFQVNRSKFYVTKKSWNLKWIRFLETSDVKYKSKCPRLSCHITLEVSAMHNAFFFTVLSGTAVKTWKFSFRLQKGVEIWNELDFWKHQTLIINQSALGYRVISPWKYLQCITRFSLLFYAEKL